MSYCMGCHDTGFPHAEQCPKSNPSPVSAPAPDSTRLQALNSLSRSEMEEGIYERVPAQEVTADANQFMATLADKAVTEVYGWPWDKKAQRMYALMCDAMDAYSNQQQELTSACNESLHRLISNVWKALEPTGEYEGDLRLTEFAAKLRSDYASLSAQLEQVKQEREMLERNLPEWCKLSIAVVTKDLERTNTVLRSALESISQGRGGCEQKWCADTAEKALAALQGETNADPENKSK